MGKKVGILAVVIVIVLVAGMAIPVLAAPTTETNPNGIQDWDTWREAFPNAQLREARLPLCKTASLTWKDYISYGTRSDVHIVPFRSSGAPIEMDDLSASACTGQHALVLSAEGDSVIAFENLIIVGDVLGSGELTLSQIIRMVHALTGAMPLRDEFAAAADLNGDSKLSISDVAILAAWFRGDCVEPDGVEYYI